MNPLSKMAVTELVLCLVLLVVGGVLLIALTTLIILGTTYYRMNMRRGAGNPQARPYPLLLFAVPPYGEYPFRYFRFHSPEHVLLRR